MTCETPSATDHLSPLYTKADTDTTSNPNCSSLHALVIKLTDLVAGTLPGCVGGLAYASFRAAIEAVDPTLAAQMHDAQNRTSFSLSPLYGYWGSPADRHIHVNRGQEGWLCIGLLDDQRFSVYQPSLPRVGHNIIIRRDVKRGRIEQKWTHE